MAASISTGCASVTYLQLALLVLAALLVNNNQGKQIRCACTSQECKDMRVRSCSTDYKCFTHLTDKRDGSKPAVVFGCVTSDAQLLCDNRGPSHTKVGLTHVQCCNDRSYCNNEDFNPKQWTLPRLQPAAAPGRPLRCACSTRDCLENKSDTCSTEFKCYTQYLNKGDGSNPVSFGCTAGSSPLLCENRPPTKAIADWPYIQCCDYSDYCNTGRFIGPPQMARLRLPLPSPEGGGRSPTNSNRTERPATTKNTVEMRRSYPLNQPLVVSVLLIGLFLMLAIMAFGFYLLYQQSRYLKRGCIRGAYERAQDDMSSALVGTAVTLDSLEAMVGPSSSSGARSKANSNTTSCSKC